MQTNIQLTDTYNGCRITELHPESFTIELPNGDTDIITLNEFDENKLEKR